jgi:hypothetical protein
LSPPADSIGGRDVKSALKQLHHLDRDAASEDGTLA